tara:strand:- start:765 stop:962 length:198 start_codon:yes stop_codon:yes gene_type:complete
MVETKKKLAFADWTDEDFEILGRIGKSAPLKINEIDLQIPSDSELTEWAESVDALDKSTEVYIED